jgi:hypothetical protein
MPTITVRFRGICCFIDKTNGEDFEKRVLLPHGGGHHARSNFEAHLPIIEFLADDLKRAPIDLPRTSYTRPGDDGRYERIEIKEPVRIEFRGVSQSRKKITRGINLDESIIHLDDLAGRKLEMKKTLTGPALKVDPALAIAVLDLPPGVLMAGPPESIVTRFPPAVKFEERRTARWVEHIMDVDDDFSVQLTPLGEADAKTQVIQFERTTRLITIANEPERMIVGHFVPRPAGTAPLNPTGHFAMHWDLIQNAPDPPLVPLPFQGSAIGCAPSNKP